MLLCRIWNEIDAKDAEGTEKTLADWEAHYQQILQSERDNLEYGEDMQRAWEREGFGEGLDDVMGDEGLRVRFDDDGIPDLGPYVFGTSSFLTIRCGIYSFHLTIFRAQQPIPPIRP